MAIRIGRAAGGWDRIDVLLICPRHPMPHWVVAPWGALALAQHLDRDGYRAAVWDCNADPGATDAGLEALLGSTPIGWVGFSLFSTQLHEARRLAQLVRRVQPDARIVVGGQHVAASSADTFPEADALVAGEGERALHDLVAGRITPRDCRHADGRLRVVGGDDHPRLLHGEIFEDVNDVPLPDAAIWETYGSFGTLDRLGLIMARGCPFDCTFCHFEERSRKARRYDPEPVAAQVETAHRATGLRDVFFLDDIFTLSRSWVFEVCDGLDQRGLSELSYSCFSHVRVGSPELYQRMAASGFRRIQLGIESGTEPVRRRMHKNFTDEQVFETVRMIKDAGMEPHALFILGYTGETPETMRATLRMAEQLETTAWFSLAQPLPGTAFLTEAEAAGTILERDLRKYGNQRIVYLPEGVSLPAMEEIAAEAEALRRRLHAAYAQPDYREVMGVG